ncbi:HNH endonuclease signature motif containing protein [Anaerococcus obesiensis]|uniref:HNH endonuclease signature motif containing protein n=2 Tax=Bacillota TaxID=1239 RepID=UPI001F206610|nr:HNH endonuclease signature motif containing protein [Anaerococcus obesiensis]
MRIIRKRYINKHPIRERCLKENIMKKVEHVHYIKPLSVGGSHDKINLMSVCKYCHSKIHAEIETDFIMKSIEGRWSQLLYSKI